MVGGRGRGYPGRGRGNGRTNGRQDQELRSQIGSKQQHYEPSTQTRSRSIERTDQTKSDVTNTSNSSTETEDSGSETEDVIIKTEYKEETSPVNKKLRKDDKVADTDMLTDDFLPTKYKITHRATTKDGVITNALRYFKK